MSQWDLHNVIFFEFSKGLETAITSVYDSLVYIARLFNLLTGANKTVHMGSQQYLYNFS